jgi:hypothetical protein
MLLCCNRFHSSLIVRIAVWAAAIGTLPTAGVRTLVGIVIVDVWVIVWVAIVAVAKIEVAGTDVVFGGGSDAGDVRELTDEGGDGHGESAADDDP